MARFNLRYAIEALKTLERERPDAYSRAVQRLDLDDAEVIEWERVAAAMTIPYSESLQIHPQDSQFLQREVWDLEATPEDRKPLMLHFHPLVIYRFQVLKQADVVLALFLQGDQFTLEEKLADFDYYDPLTTSDSSLSKIVQSIIAAEVGYQDLALDYFLDTAFVDLEDRHGNTSDGVHVAAAGGVWNSLVSGFGGMRDYSGELTFDPRLPRQWPELRYRLTWRGTRMSVTLTAESMHVSVLEGETPVAFTVRGESFEVSLGSDVTVPLSDQGPTLGDAPVQKRRNRRDDGSIMVPAAAQFADS
jgi:alpha,alpha-trehalose phosphorylase